VQVRQRPDEVEEGRDLQQDGVHPGILAHPRRPEQAWIPEAPGIGEDSTPLPGSRRDADQFSILRLR
jgi:hypothetical protein